MRTFLNVLMVALLSSSPCFSALLLEANHSYSNLSSIDANAVQGVLASRIGTSSAAEFVFGWTSQTPHMTNYLPAMPGFSGIATRLTSPGGTLLMDSSWTGNSSNAFGSRYSVATPLLLGATISNIEFGVSSMSKTAMPGGNFQYDATMTTRVHGVSAGAGVPEPTVLALLAPLGILALRRKRS